MGGTGPPGSDSPEAVVLRLLGAFGCLDGIQDGGRERWDLASLRADGRVGREELAALLSPEGLAGAMKLGFISAADAGLLAQGRARWLKSMSPSARSQDETDCDSDSVSSARDENRVLEIPGGRYRLVAPLGSGGMGVVWEATDTELDRRVAVKFHRQPIADAIQLERFLRECRIMAQLDHPNIVPIHDVGRTVEGYPYLIMKKVEGETLARIAGALAAGRRAATSRWTLGARLRLLRTVVEAVAFAHSKGVLHRDLKPGNILVDRSGRPLVSDWGLAGFFEREMGGEGTGAPSDLSPPLTKSGARVGTPGYMSPEQVSGQPADERSDIYALGAVLCEILVFRPPIRAPTVRDLFHRVLLGEVDWPGSAPGDPPLPSELLFIVKKAMALAPEDRYESAQKLADEVGRFLEGKTLESGVYSPIEVAWKWTRRHKAIAALLAVVPPAVLGMTLWLLSAEREVEEHASKARLASDREQRAAEAVKELDAITRQASNRGRDHEPEVSTSFDGFLSRHPGIIDGYRKFAAWYLSRTSEDPSDSFLSRATELLRQALQLDPEDGESRILLVQAMIGQAHPIAEMLEILGPIADSPDDTDEWVHIARGLRCHYGLVAEDDRTRRTELARQAQQHLGRAIETAPLCWPAYFYRGWIRIREIKDHQGAMDDFSRVIEISPGHALALYHRSHSRIMLGDTAGAMEDFRQLVRMGVKRPMEEEKNRLFALYGEGKYQQLIAEATELIQADPTQGAAYCYRGLARAAVGASKDAIEDFTRGIELEGETGALYYNRAEARQESGDYQGALSDLVRSRELDPNFLATHRLMGEIQMMVTGDAAAARQSFARALELSPKDARSLHGMGCACFRANDSAGAITYLERAAAVDPTLAFVFEDLAHAQMAVGQFDKVLVTLDRALAVREHWLLWAQRGMSLKALGRLSEAEESFAAAQRLCPPKSQEELDRIRAYSPRQGIPATDR